MNLSDLHYVRALSDLCDGHLAFKPPQATRVSEGAQKALIIRQPGMAGGPWSPVETPYMVEPMDMLASRLHEAVVFAGPARTGKTAGLLLGWMSHAVVNDPGDMLFVQMTQDKAREFSKTDFSRAINHSPQISAMLSSHASDRNTHDVMFRNGMWVRIAWPTVSNVSGSTYRYSAITDYDRISNADDVDGEGPLFDLARKRTTTFLSRGMCLAESSPGIELQDPSWSPATDHEAPPVTGILGLYNQSDRRRWYWQCLDCFDFFEASPGLKLFGMPSDTELLEEVRTANIVAMSKRYGEHVVCPHCGSLLHNRFKTLLNAGGIWVPDGCRVTPDRELVGEGLQSKIAGYWLGGVAATYQHWESLVLRHLQGLKAYVLTGEEQTLKTTVNTDQGMPYMSMHLKEGQLASTPESRAELDLQRYVVPPWTRCLMASVDVQGGQNAHFSVQLHAVGPHMEQSLVDRFAITLSRREGMGQQFAPIDPAGYPEDWDVLTEKLLRATWQTPIPGREIKIRRLVVDSGGEDGVTANAYAWFRRVREEGMTGRVRLYKGATEKKAPIIRVTRVGKRGEKDKGDIPLLYCNPHLLADSVHVGLKRNTSGPNYIHFPAPKHPTKNPNGWLPQSFFDELNAETRGKDGIWTQIRKRNETFDHCKMIRAGMLSLGLDKIKDWNSVPAWLAPLDQNELVIDAEERRDMKANERIETVSEPAPPTEPPKVRIVGRPRVRGRRAIPSPYLG